MTNKYFSVLYDGIDMSDIVTGFTGVNRNIGSSWTNLLDGKVFVSNDIDSKKIKVEFVVLGGSDILSKARRDLAFFFNKKELCPLTFSDEPNTVYQAIVDGEVTFEEDFLKGIGSVTFLVPSGIAESVNTQILNSESSGGANGTINEADEDNSVTVEINNQGTLPAFPRIKVTNTSENGFVGIVGMNGIIEAGDVAEADGVDITKSEMLLNAVNNKSSDYTNFIKTTRTYALNSTTRLNNGTVSYLTDGLRLANGGTGSSWHQGSMEFTLPKDSSGVLGASSFISNFNIVFESTSLKQLGYIHVMFTDSNDNVIMGYAVSKTGANNNTSGVNFYYQDVENLGSFKTYTERPSFKANGSNVKLNPGFHHSKGQAGMSKQGSKLSWLYNGKNYNVNIPGLKDTVVTKIHIEMGANGTSAKLGNMVLRRIWFQKTNVQEWSDIPNRFKENSVLQIDMGAGKIYLDERPALDLKVNGSDFFSIPVGKSEIVFTPSSWVDTPLDIEIEWEERYL